MSTDPDPKMPSSSSSTSRAMRTLADGTDPKPPTIPPELPPVEPPSAKFIIQLFVIPAAIVLILVVAYLAFVQLPFGRLANGGRDVMDYVRSIKSENEHRRWRSAQDLANLINNDPSLAKDPRLLGELTALLADELRHPNPEKPELAQYLALSLGVFQTLKAAPVDGRPVDPIATLAEALDPSQPTAVRVSAAISLSSQAERMGGSLGDPSALKALIAAAGTPEAEVRERAAYALGFFSDPDSLAALRERAQTDEIPAVRYNAGAALARRGDEASSRVLKEMLSPVDLAQTMKRGTSAETKGAVEAVELEALWCLRVSAPTKPALALKLLPEIESLSRSGAKNIQVEARDLLKILQSAKSSADAK